MQNSDTHSLFAKSALLQNGWAANVTLVWDHTGTIQSATENTAPASNEMCVDTVLPAMANLHCHAFQRAMAGLAEFSHSKQDSFWSWRKLMYQFVAHIRPEHLEHIAAFAYLQMLQSGFTSVGEFHYLHHQPGGTPYDDPAQMSRRIIAAADQTGMDVTLLPVFYAHSDFGGAAPGDAQRRFVHEVDDFCALTQNLRRHTHITHGIAPHSLRAVTPGELSALLNAHPTGPVHIHIAEQMAEVEACTAQFGAPPVRYLLDQFDVDPRWCLVHATHMNAGETIDLAKSGAVAGLCPITEANLGDGIFDGVAYQNGGGKFGIGSDSCVRIDLAEELRLLEYTQRLRDQSRARLAPTGHSIGGHLYRQCAQSGAQALGQVGGQIAPGKMASFIVLDGEQDAIIAREQDAQIDGWIFAQVQNPVQHVWVSGRQVINNRIHAKQDEITRNYKKTLTSLLSAFSN